MTVEQYIASLNQHYALGNATEDTFRADLQNLIETLCPEIQATNEPKRQACGAPDYILTHKDIPMGFIEAKNIGDTDLEGKKKTGNKTQFDRYKAALNNLIFTDYLDFHFYQEGELLEQIAIGKLGDKIIKPIPANFKRFENLFRNFVQLVGTTIKNPNKLAEMMAAKARLLAEVIERALISDEENQTDSSLKEQLIAFPKVLNHDITPKGFADVYAQTITYGMFAARLNDEDLEIFSREKAAKLIPKSNPFLRKLFGYIAGIDIDDRIQWIVDDLVEIFLASNIEELLENYGKATQMEDPIIHFYEDFLAEYDPKLRKARGVWYTPAPVVSFIVRAVDEVLKTEFGLSQGLADTSKINIQTEKGEEVVHKVQILDPATGTGTFLAEVVKQIHKKFKGQQGIWQTYVAQDLLPRLNGFELLMASYAMAHLQLDLLLRKTGFESKNNQRLRIFLTNSLEEYQTHTGTLFASWLSAEANEANKIKRETPVMCVIGNPPYAVSSSNKGTWIQNLIADYKKGLNERKINLDDDYIKFIRYGQHFIDKNGSGILAYISNNSFIDGVTHRQMRKHLLASFDTIYILDLHGNARRKEIAPDGSPDQNVFDIMQGVSINIFVKTGKKKANELGKVFHYELYGKREAKYDFLNESSLGTIKWTIIELQKPNLFFVPTNLDGVKRYNEGFKLSDFFNIYGHGVQTNRDSLFIDLDKKRLGARIQMLFSQKYNTSFIEKYNVKDSSGYNLLYRISDAKFDESKITILSYRYFDNYYVYYDKDITARANFNVQRHLLQENIALVMPRLCKGKGGFQHGMVSKHIVDRAFGDAYSGAGTNVFPLYLYPAEKPQQKMTKKYNLDDLELLELRKEELISLTEEAQSSFDVLEQMYNQVNNPDKEIKELYRKQKENLQDLKKELQEVLAKLKNNASKTNSISELFESQARKPNLNPKIIAKIAQDLGLKFTAEKENKENTFAPIDILDYIYAVLHSPSYREKYKEFLKIDFPRVPYPKDATTFWKLVQVGGELRQIHLLESPKVELFITQYPVSGDSAVDKPKYGKGKVYINETQYFDNVPQVAWEFYIGGYQPAQKWLKDRKGRKLEFEEVLHYQKIIVALTETAQLMQAIDKIELE